MIGLPACRQVPASRQPGTQNTGKKVASLSLRSMLFLRAGSHDLGYGAASVDVATEGWGGPLRRIARRGGGVWRQDHRGGPAKMTRRVFLAIMSLLIVSASLTATPDAVAADPSAFMNGLWSRTVEVLSKKVPRE